MSDGNPSKNSSKRAPPNLPPEEPAIPLEPAVAKARAAYVREQVVKIRFLKSRGKTEFEIREEMERFVEDYPTLFRKVIDTNLEDQASLNIMLAMLEKMGKSELSQHQASVIVGQRLHDKYIKPALDKDKA